MFKIISIKMKKIIVVIVVIFALGVTMTSCKDENKEVKKEIVKDYEEDVEIKEDNDMIAAVYQCTMDCEHGKTYDKPGKCPVCSMDLKKKETEDDTEEHDHD